MKCRAWVIYGTNPKLNLKYRKRKPVGRWPVNDEWFVDGVANTFKHLELEPPVKCDGNIIATIEAVDEPEWGGTSAVLRIEYKCDKCGYNQLADGMPNPFPTNADELSKFLTQVIASMP